MQDAQDADWNKEFGYKTPRTFSNMKNGFISMFGNVRQGRTMTAFKRSKILPGDLPASAALTNFADNGQTPIYFWYDADATTVYWYSAADAIRVYGYDTFENFFRGAIFAQMPDDVSGFEYFDVSLITSSSYMDEFFCGQYMPDDLSVLSHWVIGFSSWDSDMFTCHDGSMYWFKQEHMSAITHWTFPNMSADYGFSGYYLFYNNPNITSLEGLEGWDMSKYTNIYYMFAYMPNLESTKGIETWDVSNVKNLSYLFYYSPKLHDLSGIANWDTHNVTNMSYMFYKDSNPTVGLTNESLNSIAGWNISSLTNAYGMFEYQKLITDARVLNAWPWRSSISSGYMFYETGCTYDPEVPGSSTYPGWYTP
jgi:surface protein